MEKSLRAAKNPAPFWEPLEVDADGDTMRTKVPGGWLYRVRVCDYDEFGNCVRPATAIAFVPEPMPGGAQ